MHAGLCGCPARHAVPAFGFCDLLSPARWYAPFSDCARCLHTMPLKLHEAGISLCTLDIVFGESDVSTSCVPCCGHVQHGLCCGKGHYPLFLLFELHKANPHIGMFCVLQSACCSQSWTAAATFCGRTCCCSVQERQAQSCG